MKIGRDIYQKSVRILSDAETVFRALTHDLSLWWGTMDRPVEKVNDVFIVSWGEPWYQFKVIEYDSFKKITWECMDANQIIDGLEGVQKEWVGTQLVWKIITVNANEVELHFEHHGLVPNFICYNFCSATWDRFIGEELKKYIESQ